MPFPLAPFLGAAVAGLGLARWWHGRTRRRFEAQALARAPIGEHGLIVGAEPYTLEREGAPAVLLLHGAGDTPASLRYLAEALHAAGYAVVVPLLPGHGRTLREYAAVDAEALLATAREALRPLLRERTWVGIAGLSMGGALAVRLAADPALGPHVRALALLAPYLVPPRGVQFAAGCSHGWGAVVPYVDIQDPRSIHDEAERERALGHGIMTPAALRALVRTARAAYAALPALSQPALVVFSRNDNRIAVRAAAGAFERVGSAVKEVAWRDVGGHILPVDHGREEVFAMVIAWFDAHRARRVPAVRRRAAAP